MYRYLLLIVFLLTLPGPVWAVTVFEDDFIDTLNVDMTKTTAVVDTADSSVRLPSMNTPNAVAMNKYGDGYAVVTKTGIQMYEYDDSTGSVKLNNAFSVPFITDAIGVAIRQDNVNIWAIRQDGVQYVKFNGSSMADDPALKITGIGQVLSVDAWENNDKAVVLLKNGNNAQLKVYNAQSGSLVNELTQNTVIQDPVAVSIVKGTADLRVATKDSIYYLMYDDATGQYVEDISKKITGLSGIVSLSSDDSTHAIISNTNAQFILDDDTGGGAPVGAYSIGSVSGAFAISLKPGSYDQAIVTASGEVQYWRYDDATGKMVRDSSMEKTGLQLMGGYIAPKEYWSKVFSTAEDYEEVRLTVNQDIPANTSITYWVSTNGGINFTQVLPDTWTSVPIGHDFVVKAILDTTNKDITPRILYVKLEASTLQVKDLIVTAIAQNKAGQTLPTSIFPVEAKAGADVIFEVTTEGFAESVWADFTTGASVVLTPKQPITENINVWWGSFVVPVDAVDPSSIGVTLTAQRGVKQKHLTVNPFINVRGKIYEVMDLTIIK